MNIYQVIVKVTASIAVNTMFKCNEFFFAKVSGIIFQLQGSQPYWHSVQNAFVLLDY